MCHRRFKSQMHRFTAALRSSPRGKVHRESGGAVVLQAAPHSPVVGIQKVSEIVMM